jgi:hypothetical protein
MSDLPKGIPIEEFAAQSPKNAALIDQLRTDVDSGKVSACACIGPMYNELYCICEMQQRGLALNEALRGPARIKLNESIKKLFGPGAVPE